MNLFAGWFKKPAPAPKKRVLHAVGPYSAVDLLEVTAVYIENERLVIRFAGIGVIKLSSEDLYNSTRRTAGMLIDMINEMEMHHV